MKLSSVTEVVELASAYSAACNHLDKMERLGSINMYALKNSVGHEGYIGDIRSDDEALIEVRQVLVRRAGAAVADALDKLAAAGIDVTDERAALASRVASKFNDTADELSAKLTEKK